jgi:hypothetical protein
MFFAFFAACADSQSTEQQRSDQDAEKRAQQQRIHDFLDEQGEQSGKAAYQLYNDLLGSALAERQYSEIHYRSPTSKELDAISPAPADITRFHDMKLERNSGVIRMLPAVKCGGEQQDVTLRERCQRYSMPGNGSAYSFRVGEYREYRLADIRLEHGMFVAGSSRTLGFLTDLGNLNLNDVNEKTAGMNTIVQYVAPKYYADVARDWNAFDSGISREGFLYKSHIPPKEGEVFALRTIAYRGVSLREAWGHRFNELSHDERKDCVIAFQVLHVTTDGEVTLIWKLITKSESPKLQLNP